MSAVVVFLMCCNARIIEASCGDYLEHPGRSKHATGTHAAGAMDTAKGTNDGHDMPSEPGRLPSCAYGNCRSAPPLLPLERVDLSLSVRQPIGVCEGMIQANFLPESDSLRVHDELLPFSAVLDVLLDPPIIIS